MKFTRLDQSFCEVHMIGPGPCDELFVKFTRLGQVRVVVFVKLAPLDLVQVMSFCEVHTIGPGPGGELLRSSHDWARSRW